MKKLLILAVVVLASVAAGAIQTVRAGVNDFTISDYRIDLTLGRDAGNRSRLTTVETIDAVFPRPDQNRGIERAIPKTYDNHQTSLAIVAVTDGTGKARKYTTYESNGNLVVRIGEADKYVYGKQRYQIRYTQRDVTRYFADTRSDEFYWDTNGTGWRVPIDNLTVNLALQDGIKAKQTGDQQCYLGAAGSTGRCAMEPTDNGYTLNATSLRPGENATIAVGFKPGTFAGYTPSLIERLAVLWGIAAAVTSFGSVVLITWYIVRYYRKSNRTAEVLTIVPEYVPPKDTSVAAAAAIYRNARAVFAAQLIDFAVRGYIRIHQTREKSFWRKAEYELEITRDITDLKDEEQELFKDIFPDVTVGSRLPLSDLKKNGTSIAAKLRDNPGKLDADIKGAYGLRAKDETQRAWFRRAGTFTLLAAVLTLSPMLLIAAVVAFICGYILWPFTDKGLALYRYLEGLKMYIKVAETERIRMLQGADTAEKIGSSVDTNDSRQMVKLYEKTLPYAMLFGQEKTWNDRLGSYYESLGEQPGWYAATNNTVFNAAVLSSSLNDFNQAVTYSSAVSSTSGGSGGGGSSGGGGGGGGGGGW